MIDLGTKVRFRDLWSGRHEGIVVGRTREAEPHYDIRVKTTIYSNVPTTLIEETLNADVL